MSSSLDALPYDFLERHTPLAATSSEFAQIEYKLQLCLGSATARVARVFRVGNPQLESQFGKLFKDKLKVDSWADASCLDDVASICGKNGFQFGESGMVFASGSIALPPNAGERGEHLHEFILCRVAVGRSFVLSEKFALVRVNL
jgi:hypothetical protein